MRLKKSKSGANGQVVLETAFVFSWLIILTFSFINFGILFHTKNVATYAAFMAGRSYQVVGDQTGSEFFSESGGNKLSLGQSPKLFGDLKTLAAIRTAEDIFTCALPWISVPKGDELVNLNQSDLEKDPTARCMEGKRKYESLNVGTGKSRSLLFLPFKIGNSSSSKKGSLQEVADSFKEAGRSGLQYGVLQLDYRSPIGYNIFDLFRDKKGNAVRQVSGTVYVPVLLNPGLEKGLSEQKDDQQEEDPNDPRNTQETAIATPTPTFNAPSGSVSP